MDAHAPAVPKLVVPAAFEAEAPPPSHPHHPWCPNQRLRAVKMVLILIVTIALTLQLVTMFPLGHHKRLPYQCKTSAVVAKEGTRDFATISAALQSVPKPIYTRHCIFIRRGEYSESIYIGPEKANVVFIGDGVERTIITSNRSLDRVIDFEIFPTLRVRGFGFVATGLTIRNTVRREGSVALENGADGSAFYRCSIEGYHALNAYSQSQLYRSCKIQGAQDFIYGSARAIFQDCMIEASKSHPADFIVISRHERISPYYETGFVFQRCSFSSIGTGHVSSPASTYLASPVGPNSTVVIMQSHFDTSIAGWSVNASVQNTVYFAEFNNFGPNASRRTTTQSFVRSIDNSTASNFTVKSYLDGPNWIPLDIVYDPDLL